MKKPSLFKIGIVVLLFGVIGVSYTFYQADKISDTFVLNESNSQEIEMDFQHHDIGFFKVTMPNFDRNVVFVQIMNIQSDIIYDKKIETKSAVNYFDIEPGRYIMKITNMSDNQTEVEIEFGHLNSSQMQIPGIILFIGFTIVIVESYRILKNYKIAHPDENIS